MFVLINCKMRLLSPDVHTPNPWCTTSCESKIQTYALIDMNAELKILCPECGAMNVVYIDPSTHVQTAFCKECGAEIHLILKRSRPASFVPI